MKNMYKPQTVLRTAVPLKSENGIQVVPGTRVVVMKNVDVDKVRVKVIDPAHTDQNKIRLVAGNGAFRATHRGRPKTK